MCLDKLECLSLSVTSTSIEYLQEPTGAYLSVAPYGTPLRLPTNIRLGYKWLSVKNAPAYYSTKLATAVKSYKV